MTGFGAAAAQREALSVRVEIRSVNHRHFQAKTRMPSDFVYLEPEVDGILRKKIRRGSVAVTIGLMRTDAAADVNVNGELARAYLQNLRDLAQDLGIEAELRVDQLAAMPGVLVARGELGPNEREGRLILSTVSDALTELLGMREREGESLAADMARNDAAIERIVTRIEKRMPKVVKDHQRALQTRVAELLGAQVPEKDLARELALLADRLDVSEELSRLRSHLGQLGALLKKGGAVGRQLDFLAQEFFREANTIGSKCNDAQVAHLVVELKTHIERLREQVQNVE